MKIKNFDYLPLLKNDLNNIFFTFNLLSFLKFMQQIKLSKVKSKINNEYRRTSYWSTNLCSIFVPLLIIVTLCCFDKLLLHHVGFPLHTPKVPKISTKASSIDKYSIFSFVLSWDNIEPRIGCLLYPMSRLWVIPRATRLFQHPSITQSDDIEANSVLPHFLWHKNQI